MFAAENINRFSPCEFPIQVECENWPIHHVIILVSDHLLMNGIMCRLISENL